MAYTERALIAVTLDGSGEALVYSPVGRGIIDSVRFLTIDDLGTPDVDAAIEGYSGEGTVQVFWSEDNVATTTPRRVTVPAADETGVDDPAARTRVALSNQRILFTITGGTAAGTGIIEVVIEGTFSGA